MEHKQVIVLRKDLNMRKGKMVAQGAHASMRAVSVACPPIRHSRSVRMKMRRSINLPRIFRCYESGAILTRAQPQALLEHGAKM